MKLEDVLMLARAGYTKAEIAAFDNPPAAPMQPAAPVQQPAAPVQQPAAPVQPAPAAQPAANAAPPVQPMYPAEQPAVTLADVVTAVNALATKIGAPNPSFTEPAPLGLNDMVSGFLGVKGGSRHA